MTNAAIILAGGRSSRLFPFNKVLSDLTGSGRTLLEQARDRLKTFPKESIYVLTTRPMAAPIGRALSLPSRQILVDPVRRGTWPAILWAMAHLRRKHSDAVISVLTGDHVIQKESAFRQALAQAVRLAQQKPAIVMMGIPPEPNAEIWRGFGCFRAQDDGLVTQFQEKPSLEDAKRMLQEGGWSWNSGMFFFQLKTAEKALELLQPEMFRIYQEMSIALACGEKAKAAALYERFPEKIPHPLDPGRRVDNSIDYAIMAPLVQQAPAGLEARAISNIRFQWTDLGQWDALRSVLKADRRGNIRIGKVVLQKDVRNSIFVAEPGRAIEASGTGGVIVAFAGKMALVLASSHLSHVKDVAQEALMHTGRVVVEHEVTDCDIRASGGRLAAIGVSGLSIRLKGRRLVVSAKRGFIR